MQRRRCAAARESARERVRSVPHVAHRTTSPPHLFPRLIASHYGLNLSGGAPFAPPLTPPPQRLPCRTRLPQAPAVLAQVRLIGDQQLVHILPRILVNLGQPPLDVVERLHVGDVVHDDDAVGAAVVGATNRAESLLARRIPLCREKMRVFSRHQKYLVWVTRGMPAGRACACGKWARVTI